MQVRPLAHPEDVTKLPLPLRQQVVATLRQIAANPDYGKLLPPQRNYAASLGGLRSAWVNTDPDAPQEEILRIVYDVTPNAIEVVAIGLRRNSEVYKLAARRLAALRPKPRRTRPIKRNPHWRST